MKLIRKAEAPYDRDEWFKRCAQALIRMMPATDVEELLARAGELSRSGTAACPIEAARSEAMRRTQGVAA